MSREYSIVICTYNGEKYIQEVIESIIKQKEFNTYIEEIIVVDNCSVDRTKEICEELCNKYSFLKYNFEGKPGLANARKHIKFVKTKWTIFFDDDNVLCENWLINTVKYINENNKVGVVNSNSIAKPDFDITPKEKLILRAILPCIACTHISISDAEKGVEAATKGMPFGAGMCCLTEPVIQFINAGWTKNVGRKGNELGSGEDGEIVRYVLSKGYLYGYNKDSSFYHIIPEKRIQTEYISKLRLGLVKGTYDFLSQNENYICIRCKLLLRKIANIVLFPVRYIIQDEEYKRIILKMSVKDAVYFIKLILGDRMVLNTKKSN